MNAFGLRPAPPERPHSARPIRECNHTVFPVVLRCVIRSVLVAGVALAAGLALLPHSALAAEARETAGTGSAAPGWKLAKVNTLARDDVLNDITVTADGTVWAAGHRTVKGAERGLVQRFDGRSWKLIPGSPSHDLAVVTATSATNVWVFGRSKAVRWNGTSWSTKSLGMSFLPSDADGVGAKDIWAVSETGFAARHWNGTAWKRVSVPGGAKAVDAYRTDEAWAAGTQDQRPAVMRWDGSSWSDVPVPALTLPSPDASAGLNDIAVLGPSDVWAVGGVTWEGANAEGDDVTFTRTLLLHWDGASWTATVGTTNAQPYTEVEPDGRGGVWIVQSHWNSTVWRVTGGTWTSAPLPRKPGTDAVLYSIARRPRTTAVWGAGFTAPQGDPDDPSANGAFWRSL